MIPVTLFPIRPCTSCLNVLKKSLCQAEAGGDLIGHEIYIICTLFKQVKSHHIVITMQKYQEWKSGKYMLEYMFI